MLFARFRVFPEIWSGHVLVGLYRVDAPSALRRVQPELHGGAEDRSGGWTSDIPLPAEPQHERTEEENYGGESEGEPKADVLHEKRHLLRERSQKERGLHLLCVGHCVFSSDSTDVNEEIKILDANLFSTRNGIRHCKDGIPCRSLKQSKRDQR